MKKNLIVILSALVSFAIYFLLPVEKEILKGLAILFFIASLWLTETVSLTVTALLVPILAVLTGILDVKGALSHFANPVIFLFMGGFALAAALHKHGLDELIAGRIMKAAGKKSLYSILGLFLSTALLSMWISNTATTAIMLPVATPPNALVYGTERVQQRTMIKTGLYLNIIFAVVISVFSYIFLK